MVTKYQLLADSLRNNIKAGKYSETGLLPTEFEISEKFQCSRQTVRKALEQLVNEGLIEKRQGSGSYIKETPANTAGCPMRNIAVITTYISDYIFPSILREIETVFSENNCTPLLFATQNQISSERKILQNLLLLPQLDGILVEGTKTCLPNPNLDLYRQLLASGIPLVFMNGRYEDLPDAVSVLDDNYNGGRMLTEYLYSKGHRRIGGIFKSDDMQGLQRYAGYVNALRDLGLALEDQSVYWYNTEEKQEFLKSSQVAPAMLRAVKNCTALVCYNDEVASRLMNSLLKHGVRIPQDVAIVSFDNSHYSDLAPISITSLSHGMQNVGRLAAEAMVKALAGIPCPSQSVPWELIEKESS